MRVTLLDAALVVLGGVVGGVIGGYVSIEVARREAESRIQVQASELAFAGDPTSLDLSHRIQVLAAMFPEELSAWSDIDPAESVLPSEAAARWEYLGAVLDKARCPEQVVATYRALYGTATGASRFPTAGTAAELDYDIVMPACPPA